MAAREVCSGRADRILLLNRSQLFTIRLERLQPLLGRIRTTSYFTQITASCDDEHMQNNPDSGRGLHQIKTRHFIGCRIILRSQQN